MTDFDQIIEAVFTLVILIVFLTQVIPELVDTIDGGYGNFLYLTVLGAILAVILAIVGEIVE
jgi:hypothetical protein